MPDELVDVLDSCGKPTGRCKLKHEIHRDGDWHRSAHVWLATPDNRVLLQLRCMQKENHPGLWDISAAGHISAGEHATGAAIREVEEELGITIGEGDLEPLGELREQWVLNGGRYIDNELHSIFLVRRELDTTALLLQEQEVAASKLVTLDDFRARIARRDPTLVPHWAEYALLIKRLEQPFRA